VGLRRNCGAWARNWRSTREAYRRGAGTEADRREYETENAAVRRKAAVEAQRIRSSIKAAAARREIIAIGRRSPDAAEEPIKPQYWDFLDFDDPERNAVSGPGLYFGVVRFAKWVDLSPALREHIEKELQKSSIDQLAPKAPAETPGPYRLEGAPKKASAYEIMLAKKFELAKAGKIDRSMSESVQHDLVLKALGKKGDERGFSLDNFALYVADRWPTSE